MPKYIHTEVEIMTRGFGLEGGVGFNLQVRNF